MQLWQYEELSGEAAMDHRGTERAIEGAPTV